VTVLADQPAGLPFALAAVREVVEEVDRTCSRFREDSELAAVVRSAGTPVSISPVLADAWSAAIRAAEATDGLVDPTVASAVRAWGYDRDFAAVPPTGPPLHVRMKAVPGWRTVAWDPTTRTVTLPRGVELDLGATAKAWAADRAAARAADRAGCPVLVSLGGDLAIAGPVRPGGWDVRIVDDHAAGPDVDGPVVAVDAGGVATSSTTVRRWHRGEVLVHHVIDPRTGAPAQTCWRTVTVAAGTCADANAASTAAIVLGHEAPAWLAARRLPARLVDVDGAVRTVAGWPGDDRPGVAA
jgi:thiamine biosynthesis lipoprotein